MKKSLLSITAIYIIGLLFSLSACSSDRPFSYTYKSPTEVDIIYKGVTYSINTLSKQNDLPFEYEFESDGDLDLTIEGKEYELESPYDIDKKSKKKKVAKKKITKKKTKKVAQKSSKKSSKTR